MIVVVWGVSGCGKSTVGRMLADRLGWTFYDADDYHPAANKEKMAKGIPLEDDDRLPWLASLATMISDDNRDGHNAVLACSALKARYRSLLGIDEKTICSVHLSGDKSLIASRLARREHEFMNDKLLDSQFATLEPETNGYVASVTQDVDALCDDIMTQLDLA